MGRGVHRHMFFFLLPLWGVRARIVFPMCNLTLCRDLPRHGPALPCVFVSMNVCLSINVIVCQEELRTLKYSILKDKLLSVESSRAAQLQWLTEFMVFVGSHHSTLSEYFNLTFQYALNQVCVEVCADCVCVWSVCRGCRWI
jgi:hypothetical protein